MEEFNDFEEIIEFEQAKLNVDKIINAKKPKEFDRKALAGIMIVLSILFIGIIVKFLGGLE